MRVVHHTVAAAMVGFGMVADAIGEPVTVRFPGDEVEIAPRLPTLDPRLPDILIYTEWWSPGPGGGRHSIPTVRSAQGVSCENVQTAPIFVEASPGTTRVFPPNNDRYAYSDLVPGTLIDDGFGGWGASDTNCDWGAAEQELFWTGFIRQASLKDYCSYECVHGEANPFFAQIFEDGVYFVPLRYRPATKTIEAGAFDWYYGWLAFRIDLGLIDEDCDFPAGCPDEERFYDAMYYVGVSFESEIGVPAIVGAGLCEADMVPDAVLDLQDVQAFSTAFVSGESPADLNGDGVYDLADLQLFVGAFVSGCGIL